jgi:YbbR domain-containing protein
MSNVQRYGAQFGLAVLLALALWTYVSFTTNPTATRVVTVPIQKVGLADDMLIVDASSGLPTDDEQTALVTLSGPQQELGSVAPSDVRATVDLSGLGPGITQIPVDVMVEQNGLVRARERQPAEITLRLARELVATVPVSVTQEGQPPFSFSAGEMVQSVPDTVVSGPEELVRQVAFARAIINTQGQTRDVEETLTLEALTADGGVVTGVELTPDRVEVKIPIVAQVDVQQVSVVPDITGQPAPGYAVGSIDWNPKIVEVFTSGSVTGTLSTEKIDISGATGDVTSTVTLAQPGNLITRPQGLEVTVQVSIIPIAVPSQLPLIVPIAPIGLDRELEAVAAPSYVQITLAGLLDRLTGITPEQVPATIDLAGLGPGTYTLPVQIDPPEGLQVVATSDPTVRITISELPTPTPEPTATVAPTPTQDSTAEPP